MPQLDLMTFFTQFFWFSIGFSFFYIFLLHFVMSSVSLNLKFRKKRLNVLASEINKKKEGSLSLLNTYDDILLKALNLSRLYITKITEFGSSWLIKTISNVNSINFLDPNSLYIRTLGAKSLNVVILDSSLKALIDSKSIELNLKKNDKV